MKMFVVFIDPDIFNKYTLIYMYLTNEMIFKK